MSGAPDGIEVRIAEGAGAARVREAVREMWIENRAVPSGREVERRLSEVVAVAVTRTGLAVGVSTAQVMVNRAGEKVYAYRTFVSPEVRGRHWIERLWEASLAWFQARAAADPSAPRAVVFFAENPKWGLAGLRRGLERRGFRYVGQDPKGQAIWRRDLA
jgi:hypothetical protein